MNDLFQGVPWADYVPDLWAAFLSTLSYTVVSFVAAAVIGLVTALARLAKFRPVSAAAQIYTETFKNLPLITELYILYFGLASVGVNLSAFQAGSLGLALFYGAYLSEIFRAGLRGVPKAQREAAYALGLSSGRTLRHVILPQAARIAVPGTSTMMVDLLKGTSLMVAIGGGELMTQGTLIASDTFRALQVYIVIGLIYLALCAPLSRLMLRLERRMHAGDALSPSRRRVCGLIRQAQQDGTALYASSRS
ncbi:amino acid ABC transporter permease [Nonomuraea sp. NPDC048901]|uniref:amino acid ABC transporter permease n=1 Tax=unclassified Nonomuraea TaxID=2593643 RepID=UPI00340F15BE